MIDGKCYFVLSTGQVFPLGSVCEKCSQLMLLGKFIMVPPGFPECLLETVWRLLRIATSTKFNPKPCLLQNRRAASLVFIARVCPLESTSCFGRLPHVVERGNNLESQSGMVAPLTLIGRVSKTPAPNIYKALSPTCSWPGCVIMASV